MPSSPGVAIGAVVAGLVVALRLLARSGRQIPRISQLQWLTTVTVVAIKVTVTAVPVIVAATVAVTVKVAVTVAVAVAVIVAVTVAVT